MPLTALELWNGSNLDPSDLGLIRDDNGVEIIPIDGDADAQFEAAVAWVGVNVLPIAAAEVGVPVRRALGDYDVLFTDIGLREKLGQFADEIIPLWDGAELSFGRSELNKQRDSNNDEYDKDSDQDRKQANEKLKKLLDAINSWQEAQNGEDDTDLIVSGIAPTSRRVRPTL